jgi:hypothetical protein
MTVTATKIDSGKNFITWAWPASTTIVENNPVYRCPRTRSPEKRGEIFIKGQINNPNEKRFYLERYSRKEQFNSTNQSILSHPSLFPVIVARLHILLHFQ